MEKIRTRFAPSQTGFMHIGNLRTCLYAYLWARKNNGTFVLRIEDTDQERYVEGAVDVIYATLKKAGIDHDEGPDKDGGYGPYIQSERKSLYLKYAQELVEKGENIDKTIEAGIEKLKNKEILESGDTVVITGGSQMLPDASESKTIGGVLKI